MKIWPTYLRSTAMAIGILSFTPIAAHAQVEAEDRGPYYEDDAWYDITEWFDGNDYNPTDEAAGRWDDEQFSHRDARTGSDQPSDRNDSAVPRTSLQTASAQRDASNRDGGNNYQDWPTSSYYDYDENDSYEVQMLTVDSDLDGYVDAYQAWADTDGDGLYDATEHVVFADPSKNASQGSSSQSSQAVSRKQIASNDSVQGKIESVRRMNTAAGQRLVATVKSQESQSIEVDLGRPGLFSEKKSGDQKGQEARTKDKSQSDSGISKNTNMPQQGAQLTAKGTLLEWNGKKIFVATSATVDGKQVQVERDTRNLSGTVKKVKEFKSAGKTHKLVLLDLGNDQSVAVDLGQADKLDSQIQLQEGKKLQVIGLPVKVKDRRLIVAVVLKQDGNQQTIHRAGKQAG